MKAKQEKEMKLLPGIVLWAVSCVVLVILGRVISRPSPVTPEEPVLPSKVEMPLEINDGGYLFVRAKVAGQIDVKLLLDTGAGINTLSERIIKTAPTAFRSAGTHTGTRHNGETLTGPIWSVSSLSISEFGKTNIVVGQFAPPNADGLLSMDFFRDQPFTIDFAAQKLVIETPPRLKEIVANAQAIPIRLKLNGQNEVDFFVRICIGASVEAEAEFDTGAGFNMLMLQPRYMQKLGITPDKREQGALEYYVHSTFLPEIHYCAAPALRSEHAFVGFKEGLIYDALIGSGVFRDKRLTIDIPSHRMLAW